MQRDASIYILIIFILATLLLASVILQDGSTDRAVKTLTKSECFDTSSPAMLHGVDNQKADSLQHPARCDCPKHTSRH
jgi:hypothetical protein